MAAPLPCSPLGGGLHHREILIPLLLPKPRADCSAGPCIHQGHVGPTIPKRLMFPSRSHTVLASGTQESKVPLTTDKERRGGLVWGTEVFFFFLQWPGQLTVSPGVASFWYTMPLPSVTSLQLPAAGSQAGLPAGPALVPSASESSGGPAGAL